MPRDEKGRFLKNLNIYKIDGDILYCYNTQGYMLFFTNLEQEEKVKKYNWFKSANGYVATMREKKTFFLHRYLTDCPSDKLVDHINLDKRDNRLENLRICNKSQNAYNTKTNIKNTSGHKGVHYRKDIKKWYARIQKNKKTFYLGCYTTKEEAIQARKKAEEKMCEGFNYVEQ